VDAYLADLEAVRTDDRERPLAEHLRLRASCALACKSSLAEDILATYRYNACCAAHWTKRLRRGMGGAVWLCYADQEELGID